MPLTDEQLVELSGLIATGMVQTIRERDEVSHPGYGSERGTLVIAHLTVTMQVQGVEKGSLPRGYRTVCFTTEQIKAKPEGWVGGPISPPDLRVGNRVKVFLPGNEGTASRCTPQVTATPARRPRPTRL